MEVREKQVRDRSVETARVSRNAVQTLWMWNRQATRSEAGLDDPFGGSERNVQWRSGGWEGREAAPIVNGAVTTAPVFMQVSAAIVRAAPGTSLPTCGLFPPPQVDVDRLLQRACRDSVLTRVTPRR
jgi:hypothetical protein